MRGAGRNLFAGLSDPGLVGSVTILISIVALVVALQADKGLPFVPTYEVNAEVADAAELTVGADARIGGGRVGRVTAIEAVPATKGRPAYARLQLKLQADRQLPADTTVTIRPLSLLGGKYVSLTPGTARRQIVDGGILPQRQSIRQTEVFDAFNIFDKETTRGLRGVISSLGDSLAGRGTTLNETIVSARRLLPPLDRVLDTLAAPSTGLAAFVSSLDAATGALAPVADSLAGIFDHGATTLEALDAAGNELEDTIEQLAPTETIGTRALRRATPVLADAAAIARDIKPGTALLPAASRRLANTVEATTPVLGRLTGVLGPLRGTLAATGSALTEARSSGALNGLINTVASVGDTLRVLTPPQVNCNVGGIWARNLPSAISTGDAAGTWFSLILMTSVDQALQSPSPAPDLHATPYPNENASECEAGNEPFEPGIHIGNPDGNQSRSVPSTAPPSGVLDRARAAGLILKAAP